MFKKFTAFVTSLSLLITCLCITAGAVDRSGGNIPSGLDTVTYNAIYEQLEAQDALDMLDIFVQICASTNPKIVPYGSDDDITNVNAPYGGTMEYVTKDGSVRLDVAITHLDRDNTLYYVLSMQELKVSDVIIAILGYVPFIGPLASALGNARTVITAGTASSIKNAGGYAKLVTTARYDGTVSIAEGWNRYPYMYLYDTSAYNIVTTKFPKHDPFES